MAKFNQGGQWSLDGSEGEQLYKSWPNHKKPEDPRSQPVDATTGLEQVQKMGDSIVKEIMDGFKSDGVRQPTDQEMFGKLVKTQEEIDGAIEGAKKKFDEKLHAYVDWQHAKVVKSHNHDPDSWGKGSPILDDEQLEELAKANRDSCKGL